MTQVKHLSAIRETGVQSLGWKDSLEKETDAHLHFCFPTCNHTKSKQKMMFPKAPFSTHIAYPGGLESRMQLCSQGECVL